MTRFLHVHLNVSHFFAAPGIQMIRRNSLSVLLYTLMITLLIINVRLGFSLLARKSALFSTFITHPFSAQSYLTYADIFKTQKQSANAKQEILLLKDIISARPPNVLGAMTTITDSIANWESQPNKLKTVYSYWENVARKNPDYRDAYIQAAIAVYQLGNTSKARELFEVAKKLDPSISQLFQ